MVTYQYILKTKTRLKKKKNEIIVFEELVIRWMQKHETMICIHSIENSSFFLYQFPVWQWWTIRLKWVNICLDDPLRCLRPRMIEKDEWNVFYRMFSTIFYVITKFDVT